MDATESMLSDMEYRIEEQIRRSELLQRAIASIDVTEKSPYGEVTVTVDSVGALTGLRLGGDAMQLDADELAALVIETTRSAQVKLATRMKELARTVCGGESETVSFIASAYARQFPETRSGGYRGRR